MKLEELIPQYYEHKQELDKQKKIVDGENADIKRLMEEDECTKFILPDDDYIYTANYIVAKKESFREDELIALLKANGFDNLIQTKEYVDMDALENALYHDEISKDVIVEMEKCKEVKETIQLRVTKKKGAKENDD